MRKRQLKDIYGNDIYYAGTNPYDLSAVTGTISNPWVDFTDFVSGLDKISLSWSVDHDSTGQTQAGNFAPKKGVTGTLSFERDAYEFIKAWLISDVAAPLNQIEVQITDTGCGRYVGYTIKAEQLSWCEFNSLCVFDLTLKQKEEWITCIQKTVISDNWNGWFQNEPLDNTTGLPKKHPRFSYCLEKRPNGVLIIEWYLAQIAAMIFFIISVVLWPLFAIVHFIAVAINAIIGVINTIITFINTLGAGMSTIPTIPEPPIPDPLDTLAAWAEIMLEAAGCGREHPAPLVRDYILNVCNKCGVRVDATTADIFFAPLITLTKSDGLIYTDPNPHYNACLFYPQSKRGVRRYRTIDFFTGASTLDTTTFFLEKHAPVWSLTDMLDFLKPLYNMQWKVVNVFDAGLGTTVPYLYIKRKDWYFNQVPIYDFSFNGADRSKIVEGICYEPQEFTAPASVSGLYKKDTSDKCGDEAWPSMNDKPLSFNNTTVNPLFHGILDKTTEFAATKFLCDGASTNYLYDAIQVLYSGSFIATFSFLPILSTLKDFIERYTDFAVLLQTEAVSAPKILIWDGDTDHLDPVDTVYINARAVRDRINLAGTLYTIGHTGYPGTTPGISTPTPNPLYPSQVPSGTISVTTFVPSTVPAIIQWEDNHPPETEVLGRLGYLSAPPDGKYQVKDIFGTVVLNQSATLVNYPMYFTPYYKDSMWDCFHWIDDPYRYPRLHKNWSVKIPLCCDDLERLKMLDDASEIKLLNSVLLDSPFYNLGLITSINANYDYGEEGTDDGTGQTIEIKGIV